MLRAAPLCACAGMTARIKYTQRARVTRRLFTPASIVTTNHTRSKHAHFGQIVVRAHLWRSRRRLTEACTHNKHGVGMSQNHKRIEKNILDRAPKPREYYQRRRSPKHTCARSAPTCLVYGAGADAVGASGAVAVAART